MPAAITDLLDRVTDSTTGRPVVSSLATPGMAVGASSINLTDATNWTLTTAIHFSIYKVNAQGYKDPTTQTDWKGILSGTSIGSLVLTGGSAAQAYVAGDIVELTPTERFGKDLYDWGNAHANQDGSLKTAAVQAALNIGNTPSAGWTPIGAVPVYAGNNGNKEFLLNYPADLTATLSKGMKLQVTRSVAVPAQCMKFVKSSVQWANKVSPAGYTFTGPFSIEAFIYLTSYPSGSAGAIFGRRNGNVGANYLRIDSTGQLSLLYGDGSGNFTQFQTNLSIPLNRMIHVAGVVTSVSGKTGVMYVNGFPVPFTTPLSAAATLVQSGDLGVGGYTTGLETFDGYISEARVWSTALSQANIQANMAISLTGPEANLVALVQGNGNFNDKTSNANNLTANNGAIATQAANPYNTIEYGFVTNVGAFSGGNTPVMVFCGTDCNIPNMVLSNPQYSIDKTPYGFPAARGKWIVETIFKVDSAQASPVSGTWYNPGNLQLSIPTGEWYAGYSSQHGADRAAAGRTDSSATLSTANNSESDARFSTGQNNGAAGVFSAAQVKVNEPLSVASQTTFFLNGKVNQASMNDVYFFGTSSGFSPTIIRAECAYF